MWNKSLKSYLKDKSIAVVGNARSIFSKINGKEIDNHDIVIRFNFGYPVYPRAQGTKTNILFMAFAVSDEVNVEVFNPDFVLYRRKCKKMVKNRLIYKQERYHNIQREMGGKDWRKNRPSSGYMMIKLLKECDSKIPIDIYGFDWGRTQTFYNDPNYKTPHNYGYEECKIQKMEEEGFVRIK